MTQSDIMQVLGSEWMTARAIAEALGIRKDSVLINVRGLVRTGMIERRMQDPDDRRSKYEFRAVQKGRSCGLSGAVGPARGNT